MDFETAGIIDLTSPYRVAETAGKLAAAFESHGLTVFARIDQQAAARGAGLDMPPMELILFGNPAAGTPLMTKFPTLAVDLPLKALVWEDNEGAVHVGYNSPDYLQQRHGLPQPPFGPVGTLIAQAIA
jgi:uncharacterized protein (DUF302 family)